MTQVALGGHAVPLKTLIVYFYCRVANRDNVWGHSVPLNRHVGQVGALRTDSLVGERPQHWRSDAGFVPGTWLFSRESRPSERFLGAGEKVANHL